MLAGWFFNTQDVGKVIEQFIFKRDCEFLYQIDGQFILALYSEDNGSVEIFRDRIGTFPIVYSKGDAGVAISVNIDDVKLMSDIASSPSNAIFEQWPLYRKTFAPYSPFDKISGLAPEYSLIIKGASCYENRHPMKFPNNKKFPTLNASSRILGDMLSHSVQKRIESSRRMGALLSGGNDSSLIVALVRKYHAGTLKTLFVTFEDNPRDYGNYARMVADRYATDHLCLELNPNDYLGCWADTINVLQTPVPMPCHIGIHSALKMLSGSVDLMIDGDGADTVFGSSIWPQMLLLSRLSGLIPRFIKELFNKMPNYFAGESMPGKILGMSSIAMNNPLSIYPHVNAAMISMDEFNHIFQRGDWHKAVEFRQKLTTGDFFNKFFSYLMLHGIPEDIATTVRLGLNQGIFFAYPFLDYELLQTSMRLPNRLRYHYRIRKAPLKKYSLNFFDRSFIYKPKEGFGVPLSKWFTKKEFKPFLMLPLEKRSIKRGWWNESELRRLIDLHMTGKGSDSSAEAIPWIIINMELWARICIEGDSPTLYK